MTYINSTFSEINNLKKQWNQITQSNKTPLISFEYFKCCENALNTKHLKIITITNNNNIIAATALTSNRKIMFFDRYEILGSSLLHEPSNLIYNNRFSLEKILITLTNLKSPFVLQRIPHNIPIREILNGKNNEKFIYMEKNTIGSQYLNLESDIGSFEAQLSSKRRSDLRRVLKKAKSLGKVTIDILKPSLHEVDKLIQLAFEIENSSWKSENSSSILKNKQLKYFFTCYFKKLSTNNKLVIGFLKINDKIIAMQIAQDEFNKIWLLKIGQNDNFKKISPGIILTHEMIKYAISKKRQGFEFLGSQERWIELWKPKVHQYKVCAYYPANLSGAVHLVTDTLNRIIQKLK